MIINPSLIQASIERAKRTKFDPVRVAARIGEGDRSSRASVEQRRQRYRLLLAESGDAERARAALERLLGGNDLVPINYLARGTVASRAVCRIRLRDSSGDTIGFGTGFLVGPGILMTNHHVISGVQDARGALAEFNYELDLLGQEKAMTVFAIQSDPPPIASERLDFCLVSVAPGSLDGRQQLADFAWVPLNPAPGKTVMGEYLTIIQHPGGEPKQICVRENKLLKYDETGDTLWYQTDTVAGSSGSPVFNNSWQVVALHHSGIPKTDAKGRWLTVDGKLWDRSMDESKVAWIANEGIRISRILAYLNSAYGNHPLARPVIRQPVPPRSQPERLTDYTSEPSSEYVDGELRVTLPVQIAVRLGNNRPTQSVRSAPGDLSTSPSDQVRALPTTGQIEKVEVDQSNYDKRPGYKPDFLGSGPLRVALPKVKNNALKNQILTFTFKGKKGSELKYWNYGVVMHKARKLAIFSAVNVDANLRPDDSNREGDQWYHDRRLQETDEINQDFYGEQRTFEADRTSNPFDRGHLTRRMDAQWGASPSLAKRNGDDSFHWTNCSPQHWSYNEGAKRWLGLEDYVIDTFAKDTGRACVINGPVFDAPLSSEGADGRVVPNLTGAKHKDPSFGGVSIPKLFFKVVACRRSTGTLAAAAFLMSQEDFLITVDRLKGMPPLREEKLSTAEARLYQVAVVDLEKLTGLDFGPLGQADTKASEGAILSGPRVIEEFPDVRL